MDNPTWEDRTPDELAGTPELFASNLVIVEAIEKNLRGLELIREPEGVTVIMHYPSGKEVEETLTENPENWERVTERFRSITEFDSDRKGELKPQTPARDKLDAITIEYHEDDTISIRFRYPDGD